MHGKTDAGVLEAVPEADEKQQANFGVEKDRLFCALYREHCAKHGPPMVKGLAEALEAARAGRAWYRCDERAAWSCRGLHRVTS